MSDDYAADLRAHHPGPRRRDHELDLAARRDGRTAAALPAAPAQGQPKPRQMRPVFAADELVLQDAPIYYRDDLQIGDAMPGPAVITEDRNHDHRAPRLCWRASTRSARSCSRRNQHELQRSTLANPPAADVGPADLGRRGAGADAGAHRLLHLDARGRRPVGRRVRSQRRHAGAGRHRDARATSTRWRARCATSSPSSRSTP